MRKLVLALGSTLAIVSPLANADVVGVGASVSYWDSDISGKAGNSGDFVDVDSDLGLDSDSNASASLNFEHPIPLLPNIRVAYTSIDSTGRGTLQGDFDNLNSGDVVRSELELDQTDLTLYYEVLDNWVNLDLGLTARNMDGKLVSQSLNTFAVSQTDVDAIVPMAYVAARFDLPLTGLSVGGELNGISYGGDSVYDYNAYGQFEIAVLQLRAGYRQITVDYEDGDDQLDIDVGGPFVSAGLAF